MIKNIKKQLKKVENIRYARDLRCTVADFCNGNIPDYILTYDTSIDRTIGISLSKYEYKNSSEMIIPMPYSLLIHSQSSIDRLSNLNNKQNKFKTVTDKKVVSSKKNVDIFWFGRKLEENGYHVISCKPRFTDTLFVVRKLEQKDLFK
jgi:hypothetical protein